MSSQAASDRVDFLLATANEHVQADKLAEAASVLREASHIDSESAKVKEAWLGLQSHSGQIDALECVRRYLENRKDEDGQKALQALKGSQLDCDQAREAINILVDKDLEHSFSNSLAASLISHQTEARRILVKRLIENATDTHEAVFPRGDNAYNAFASLPLDDTLWTSKDVQKTAQRDLFRLNIATLIEPGVQHPERAMRALARQVALAPGNIIPVVDADILEVILNSLDLRLSQGLRNQAMLVASKLLEATGENGEGLFTEYVLGKISRSTNDDLIVAFSAAAAIFPVIPAVVSKLFMTEGFVQQLVPNLERNSEAAAAGKRKSNTLEQAALELLSAACMNKACREAINRYCSPWLKALAEEREGMNKALAALVLAKVIGDSADNDVTAKLSELVLQDASASDQAIEGLAYTSLQPKVKEDIVSNTKLLRSLVAALNTRPSVAFGCLTAFSNITAYKPTLTAEQKKMAQLKAYANSSKPASDDPLENDGMVTRRCKYLLDADIVPALVTACRSSPTTTTVALTTRILLSLARTQPHRPKMAQQGAIKLLLQIRDRLAKSDKPPPDTATIEHAASHALARLLISLNPAHIFSPTLPASSAVAALIPLLSPASTSQTSQNDSVDLLPTFETLLALTNLASMPDPTPRDLLLRAAWPTLENSLLLSSNTLVQRASVELVCNLMASPAGVALFADGSAQASNRLHILLALADVEDLPTRRAAGGALAMLTEWDAAVEGVLGRERGVKVLLGLVGDGDEGCRHRGLVALGNMVDAPGDVGERGRERVRGEGGVEVLRGALRGVRDAEVLGIGVEVLKKIT